VLGYLARGGTERQVAYLSSGLVQRGHKVRILLLGQRLEDDYPVAAGVQVLPLQITKLRHCFAGWRELRAAFRSSDVVYSFLDIANVLCALDKPQNGAPLVWGLRAANTSAGWMAQLGLWLSQRLCGRADALVANSQAVRDYYQQQGIGGAHTSVIANGVQRQAATATRAELGNEVGNEMRNAVRKEVRAEVNVPQHGFVGLVLARVAAEKRQELGLQLLQLNPELHLIFAGDEVSQLPALWQSQGLATASVLQRCRFLEHQTEIARLLSAADVLLSLSSVEGFPNSVLEAMAHEVPVVATAVGGVVELLSDVDAGPGDLGEFGWLVPVVDNEADVQAIAQALVAVQHGGPELERRILNARRRVEEHFGVEQMVDRSAELLTAVVHSHPVAT
jgi:glycosyltransferase involved in cell wall biosynthesis